MKKSNLVRIVIFSSVLLSFLNIGFSHDGEEESKSSFSPISPLYYFAQGDYFTGFFVIVFWIVILKGLFELSLLLLNKAFIVKEK